LVPVLPTEPVTATILAWLRSRAARANASSPAWVSGTASSRAGSVWGSGRSTIAAAAPSFSADSTKS
jgi:hypothetical protein